MFNYFSGTTTLVSLEFVYFVFTKNLFIVLKTLVTNITRDQENPHAVISSNQVSTYFQCVPGQRKQLILNYKTDQLISLTVNKFIYISKPINIKLKSGNYKSYFHVSQSLVEPANNKIGETKIFPFSCNNYSQASKSPHPVHSAQESNILL